MDEQRICNVERELATVKERMKTHQAEHSADFARLSEDLARRDADLAARFADMTTSQATLEKNLTARIERLAFEMDKRFLEAAAAASGRETRFILSSVGVLIGSLAIVTTILGYLITAS